MDTRAAVARAIAETPSVDGRTLVHAITREEIYAAADAAITAHLKALADAGLIVAPREPTEAMVGAAYLYDSTDKTYDSRYGSDFRAIYRAMIQETDNG